MAGEEARWVSRIVFATRISRAYRTFPLFSNPALEFVAAPALAPAEVQVDAALMEQYQKELAQASFFL